MKAETPARLWPADIFQAFKKLGIAQVAYVPDAGHTQLILDCNADPGIEAVSLTTEQEGVAMLAGAWLGGDRGALLMQSSGAGNCMNMLSLAQECRFPLLMLITMRGQWGEFNPWQVWMGSATRTILEQCGVVCYDVDDPDRVVDTVGAASNLVFNAYRSVAVLIGQRVIGSKSFAK